VTGGNILINLRELADGFITYIKNERIELYNEFSFQHELGIFLRLKLPHYNVQFEKNVSYFLSDNNTVKKEIDIVVFNDDKTENYAIELKYPLNGQYPEQMYAFVKDIKFMEQLKDRGFTKTACLTIVESKPFYSGVNNQGIYSYFRQNKVLTGEIFKPTGLNKGIDSISLNGSYSISWNPIDEKRKFYLIEIS